MIISSEIILLLDILRAGSTVDSRIRPRVVSSPQAGYHTSRCRYSRSPSFTSLTSGVRFCAQSGTIKEVIADIQDILE